MNSTALEEELLHLPVNERAKLAKRLLESLDELSEPESEKLWKVEIERRVEEIDDGNVKLVSSDVLESKVQARLK